MIVAAQVGRGGDGRATPPVSRGDVAAGEVGLVEGGECFVQLPEEVVGAVLHGGPLC